KTRHPSGVVRGGDSGHGRTRARELASPVAALRSASRCLEISRCPESCREVEPYESVAESRCQRSLACEWFCSRPVVHRRLQSLPKASPHFAFQRADWSGDKGPSDPSFSVWIQVHKRREKLQELRREIQRKCPSGRYLQIALHPAGSNRQPESIRLAKVAALRLPCRESSPGNRLALRVDLRTPIAPLWRTQGAALPPPTLRRVRHSWRP